MSARHWYVVGNDHRRRGPLSDAELAQFARSAQAGPRSMAWRDGLDLWIPIAEAIGGPSMPIPAAPPGLPEPAHREGHHREPPKRSAAAAARAVADEARDAAREAKKQIEREVQHQTQNVQAAARAKAEAALARTQADATRAAQAGCRRAMLIVVALFGALFVLGIGGTALVAWLESGAGASPSVRIDGAMATYRDGVAQFRAQTDRCPQDLAEVGLAPSDGTVLQSVALGETDAGQCALLAVLGPEPLPELQGTRMWWWQTPDGRWECLAESTSGHLPVACF